MYGFNYDGINRETNDKYDINGFDHNRLHKDTRDIYDTHGFDINCLHKDTHTFLNKYNFDIKGYWYSKDGNGNNIKTSRKYDLDGFNVDGVNKFGFNREKINVITGKKYDAYGFDNEGYFWEGPEDNRRKTDRRENDRGFDRFGNRIEYKDGKRVNMGKVYDEYGFFFDGTHYRTHTKYDERGFDHKHYWHPLKPDGTYGEAKDLYDENGWDIEKRTIRHKRRFRFDSNEVSIDIDKDDFLDYVDEHGFDFNGNYHNPCKMLANGSPITIRIDQDGFGEFFTDTIYYKAHAKQGKNRKYDIHGFNQQGIHRLTGTKLDPHHFDIDGYYYKRNEHGEMVNTGLIHDERGFTIDKKAVFETPDGLFYRKYVDGYDFYGKNSKNSFFDDHGFDRHNINYETGTELDSRGFDRYGYFHDYNVYGVLVNTGRKFDNDGWSQNKTHISTGRVVDSHGFDYLHMFKKGDNKYDLYDKHGFDYQGIHKTTKTKLNRNNFDIDGYYYKANEDGEMVNTGSKYDDDGLTIDMRDKHEFSRNGKYKGSRKNTNPDGFYVDGTHYLTGNNYDLNGRDIDGNRVELTEKDIERIMYLRDQKRKMYTVLIEDFYEELEDFDKELILAAYDMELDEFEENDYFTCFINDVKKNCSKSDYSDYTDEEILEFIKEKCIEKHNQDRKSELDEFFDDYYEQKVIDGDVPYEDYKDSIRFK